MVNTMKYVFIKNLPKIFENLEEWNQKEDLEYLIDNL